MRWLWSKKPGVDREQWHLWYAWWPTRISDCLVIWLEYIERRYVVDDQGTWAGGFVSHWEYRDGSVIWKASESYD